MHRQQCWAGMYSAGGDADLVVHGRDACGSIIHTVIGSRMSYGLPGEVPAVGGSGSVSRLVFLCLTGIFTGDPARELGHHRFLNSTISAKVWVDLVYV